MRKSGLRLLNRRVSCFAHRNPALWRTLTFLVEECTEVFYEPRAVVALSTDCNR